MKIIKRCDKCKIIMAREYYFIDATYTGSGVDYVFRLCSNCFNEFQAWTL